MFHFEVEFSKCTVTPYYTGTPYAGSLATQISSLYRIVEGLDWSGDLLILKNNYIQIYLAKAEST